MKKILWSMMILVLLLSGCSDNTIKTTNTPVPSAAASAAVLASGQPSPTPSKAPDGKTGYILTSGGRANVRASASSSANILAKLERGTKVDILEKGSEWSKIKCDATTGYISSSLLSVDFVEHWNFYGNTNASLLNSQPFAQQNDWLYFCDDFNHTFKMKTDGSNIEKISDNISAYYINVVGEYLYYSDNVTIFKVSLNDMKNPKKICSINGCNELMVIGNWIYYTEPEKLYKIDTQGNNKKLLASNVYTANFTDDYIYYSEYKKGIYRIDYEGVQNEKIVDCQCIKFLVDGSSIYFQNYTGNNVHYEIYKVDLDGSNKQKIVDNGHIAFVYDGMIYYYTIDKNTMEDTVYRSDLNGNNPQNILSGLKLLNCFYRSGDKIFFYNSTPAEPNTGITNNVHQYVMNLDGSNLKKYDIH